MRNRYKLASYHLVGLGLVVKRSSKVLGVNALVLSDTIYWIGEAVDMLKMGGENVGWSRT
jgi:hypothetical protein